MKKRAPTRADLLRKIEELEAQQAGILHFADVRLPDASIDKTMGSAIIVRLHALGGREITPAFAIRDGLSQATIDALRADINRSYELATMFKPRGIAEKNK